MGRHVFALTNGFGVPIFFLLFTISSCDLPLQSFIGLMSVYTVLPGALLNSSKITHFISYVSVSPFPL
jgi:hypothetical protein